MFVDEERILNALEKIPAIPNGADDFIKKLCPDDFKRDFIIYKSFKPKKLVSCFCTSCHSEFYLPYVEAGCACSKGYYKLPKYFGFENPEFNEYVFSSNSTLCPCCSKPVTAFHTSDVSKGYVILSKVFVKLHVIDGMIFVIRWLFRYNLHQDGTFSSEYFPIDGNVFCKQFRAYVTHSYLSYNPYSGYTYIPYFKWFLNVKYKHIPSYSPDLVMPIDESDFLDSDFPNCHLDVYLNNISYSGFAHLSIYLNVYRYYPNVENLVVNGAVNYLNSIFGRITTLNGFREVVNVKEKSPFSMIGLSRQEFRILINKLDFDYERVSFYSRNKSVLPLEDFLYFEDSFGVSDMKRLEKYSYGFLKPLRYLQKQEKNLSIPIPVTLLTDYWDMMNALELKSFSLFPQDILKAHDKASRSLFAKKNNTTLSKYKLRYKSLSKYSFEYNDLVIFPCGSDDDLFREGEFLQHCVYSYAERYIAGNTALFFIRKKDKLNVPFYTLEFDEKNLSIRQNHGYKNELFNEKDPDVIEFEKVWLDFVKKIKEKKNGKKRVNYKSRKSSIGA